MANLLLLKDLLPDVYKVLGTPSRVLIISPFKTPFGYIEAVVEEQSDKYVIENQDFPNHFELLGVEKVLKRLKDFSMLPVKFEDFKIYIEVPKENGYKDLITLAKYVDAFIKDLYDFLKNLTQLEEVKRKIGGVDALLFKFEEIKGKQREKLKEKAKQLEYEISELYGEIKDLVIEIDKLIEGHRYIDADQKLQEAIRKLGYMDSLRNEYKKITGKEYYSFYSDILRSTLFELQERLEKKS